MFSLDTCVIGAGTSERELANSLEDDLTDVGVLIAYDLQVTALPLLLSVTNPGEYLSIAALASAPLVRFCDLTTTNWAKTLVTFQQACERAGIEPSPPTRSLTRRCGGSGYWQTCAAASAQFDAWLEQHPLPVFDRNGRRLPTSRPRHNA